jgi:hypothetical protein
MTAAYSAYSLGAVALCPRGTDAGASIALWNRTWAFWGGAFSVIGLFKRIFSAGVDHMALQMAGVLGADQAYAMGQRDTYRASHVFRYTNPAVMAGGRSGDRDLPRGSPPGVRSARSA